MVNCPKCNKPVYFAEKCIVLKQDWHKACVKCSKCNKKLEPGSLSDRDGQIYCKNCYGMAAGLSGYGVGGTLSSFTGHGGVSADTPDNRVPSAGPAPPTQFTANKARPVPVNSAAAAAAGGGGGGGGRKFCGECGAKSAGTKFCGECGKPMV